MIPFIGLRFQSAFNIGIFTLSSIDLLGAFC